MTSNAPRVLFLIAQPPNPPISGDRLRNFHLMRLLETFGWSVKAFTPRTPIPSHISDLSSESAERAPISTLSRHRAATFVNILLGRAYHRSRDWDRRSASQLRRYLADEPAFDVYVIGQLFMHRYLPEKYLSRAVLDTHNSESRRIDSMKAWSLRRMPRSVSARLQFGPITRYETSAAQRTAHTLAVSPEEAAYFSQLAPGRVSLIPNGVDTTAVTPNFHRPGKSLLFLGSMDYGPNVDACRYLIREVIPRLKLDGLRLTIVGANPPDSLRRLAGNSSVPTTITGFVPSVKPFIDQSSVLAVPIRAGGGTRLKILEALAHGLPIVSTSLGCEGLRLTPETEILIADDPVTFARQLHRVLVDPALAAQLGHSGRKRAVESYDWTNIVRQLDSLLRTLAFSDNQSSSP